MSSKSRSSEFEKDLEEVNELIFSSETPDLVLGLQRCLEHVDNPHVGTFAAFCLIQGLGTMPNPEYAIDILTRHQDDSRAKALLAECYTFGKGVEKDVFRGAELLESAQSSGDLYAYLVSGDCYRLGIINIGMPEPEKATEAYCFVLESKASRCDTPLMKCLAHMRLAQALDGHAALEYLHEAVKFGYPVAWYELGQTMLDNVETDEDSEVAFAKIERAAEAKYLPACLFLARGWSNCPSRATVSNDQGLTLFPELNLHKALKYYMYASEQGHHELREFMFKHCLQLKAISTYDVCTRIVETFLTRSLKENNADAQVNLGLCYYFGCGVKQDCSQAFEWYLKAAHQGHACAEFWVGWCYSLGQGTVQDDRRGVEWYQKSASQGDVNAQNELGRCYEEGQGITQDYKQAFEWYSKSANQGHANAQHTLGYYYTHGQGVARDYKQAFEWFQKAANQGCAASQNNLGLCYKLGRGVTRNYRQAVEWYRKAGNQGNATAQYRLGVCYKNGEGVTRDYKLAFEWYQRAANRGYVAAQNSLAFCYRFGHGVMQDDKQAFEWAQKAANQGHAPAQVNLGLCYEHGHGVTQDHGQAFEWYKKAAHQDFAAGQRCLGLCYYHGRSVTQNYELAVGWFEKSANENDPEAQYHLGMCYENGEGVTQNYEIACEWYRKAADQGCTEALQALVSCSRLVIKK